MLRRMREAIQFLRRGRSFVVESDVPPEEVRRRIEALIDEAPEPSPFHVGSHWEGNVAEPSFELRHSVLASRPLLVKVRTEPIADGCRLTAQIRAPLSSLVALALLGVVFPAAGAVLLARQELSALPFFLLPAVFVPVLALARDHHARTAEQGLRRACTSERIALGEGAYRAVRVRVETREAPAELPREAKKRDLSNISEL